MSRPILPVLTLLFSGLTAPTHALLQAMPSPPNAAIHVNINGPSLLERVKTPEGRSSTLEKLQFLRQSASYAVGPDALTVQPPTNLKSFVRQALSGQAAVVVDTGFEKIPPQPLEVQVVASDWGALTVQIRNPLLPKLPLVGLPDTPPVITNMVAPLATQAAPAALEIAGNIVERATAPPSPPFWTTPIDDWVVLDHPLTPLDIVGTSSLALGAAYAGSYAYYQAEMEREEREASERKAAAAAKRAAAAKEKADAAPRKKAETPKEKEAPPKKPETVVQKAATTTTPAKEQPTPVTLPAGKPQLQRSIAKETSIALASDSTADADADADLSPEPKKRFFLVRLFKRLFGRKTPKATVKA